MNHKRGKKKGGQCMTEATDQLIAQDLAFPFSPCSHYFCCIASYDMLRPKQSKCPI